MFRCRLHLIPLPFLLFLTVTATAIEAAQRQLPGDEVQALKDIAAALKKTSWNFSINPCSEMPPWNVSDSEDAVHCNCTFSNYTICHVTSISLKMQSLPGTLPPDFVRLPYLQNLGSIPPEWGALPNLLNISLLGNRLTGPIPKEIGNISTLQSFVVEFNQLSGNLPQELGNLSQLDRLLLTSNNFTGELPSTFANLTALKQVLLGDNQFSGKIPEFIQNWKNLKELVLQASGFRGPIPSSLGALGNLTDLRITDLDGTESHFPYLASGVGMETLILRNCNLIGELPGFLSEWTGLETLDVSFNKFSGEIPTNYSSLKDAKYIYLSSNMLTGQVPDWIMNEAKRSRDLSDNNFTTESVPCTDREVNLFASSSEKNNSKMLSCLGAACPERSSDNLHINCGGIEVTVNSTTYNEDTNQRGPSTLFRKSPYNWAYSSTGHFLDYRVNENRYIVNDENRQLPQLYMTARISPISLTYYGFCLTRGKYKVTLHFAEIIFTGNKSYSSLGRRYFDVYIQGKRVLQDFNMEDEAGGVGKPIIKSFDANVTDGTLEIRFHWAGRGTTAIPYKGVYGPLVSAISAVNIDSKEPRSSEIPVGAVIGIVAGILVGIFLIVCILWRKGCLGQKFALGRDTKGLELQTSSFTLQEMIAATNNFSDANKIGEGGFGPVYKGILSDGRAVAVKQLSHKSRQGNREFLNEIGMISVLQHPNLVKLYGCCVEGDQLLLVYEYLENNSLAQALFEKSVLNLNWQLRHMICVGIARGLAFIHEESSMKIVHRDIKASNVLLDKSLNPKISDFGLAKLSEDDTHISTRIAGTYGYMAPEYAMHGYLTDKADVYSFGIVALEIISGRSNTSHKQKGEPLYLVDWAHVLKEKGMQMDLIDPRLGSDFKKDEVMVMINVALLCTSISPAARPPMSSVVRMLERDEEVPAPIPRSTVINDAEKIEAMRRHFNGCMEEQEDKLSERNIESFASEAPPAASSISRSDLYPIIWNSDYWRSRSPS
ncbi:probable leucine-rich repeat receptor-like serine/threonine-protein kinase At3g14840 isoform X2 [Punica granatum]|uniref:non-specific serine/threonine protein kinase n=1 Tax=Punica granatum TaxID=22663 RepID=A0A6P8EL00_PUNGR|nr:probable leucine-rich repeat receptor-like serine/threonine-protein kinase At3g14840 isoform X2 [Punica granatum]